MRDTPAIRVSIQAEDFDVSAELSELRKNSNSVGGIASFVGVMRDANEGDAVLSMTLEHYPGMTESSIRKIIEDACRRWPIHALTVIHRVGELRPGEQIVLVAVAAAHRGEAFSACEFVMDYLKTRAPFWKKEKLGDSERWVEARKSDEDAAKRW